MDIGNPKDNYTYYEGYEGEPEIMIESENDAMQRLHIWEGYFDDLLRDPKNDGNGWIGFTRDYHQCEGAFDDDGEAIITDLQEYIDDLKIYKNRVFDYKETKEVYELIYSWLTEAQKNNCREITVRVI